MGEKYTVNHNWGKIVVLMYLKNKTYNIHLQWIFSNSILINLLIYKLRKYPDVINCKKNLISSNSFLLTQKIFKEVFVNFICRYIGDLGYSIVTHIFE